MEPCYKSYIEEFVELRHEREEGVINKLLSIIANKSLKNIND